jgi:hypothetical protein
MKTILVLLGLLIAGSVLAEQPKPADNSLNTVLTAPLRGGVQVAPSQKPNEIIGDRFIYTGIVVQVAKTKNPLQLINPWAPKEYGTGDCNLDRDIITGKPTGFKVFSIKF